MNNALEPKDITSEINQEIFPIDQDNVISVYNDPMLIRDKINHLESEMMKAPQLEIKTTHYFSDGIYAREIFIPKGTLLTGKIHKTEHMNICSQGDISVLTENGIKRIKAPFTMSCRPGTKRVGYAHEDTVWTTIHGTHETDLKMLESELIAKSHDQVESLSEKEIQQLKGGL